MDGLTIGDVIRLCHFAGIELTSAEDGELRMESEDHITHYQHELITANASQLRILLRLERREAWDPMDAESLPADVPKGDQR